MSDTGKERCSGYKGHWACGKDYPDHMVPRYLFSPNAHRHNGLQDKCRKCKELVNASNNGSSNAVSKGAYRRAGGVKAFYALPKAERLRLRELERTSNVIPFTPKENFGPRTPMTRRKSTEVTGNKVPEGWVYIVRNPEVPQYLKIGKTFPNGIGDIMTSARRYGRAELVFKCEAAHAEYAEKKIAHVELSKYNLRNKGYTDVGTEVFEAPLKKAIEVVKMACDIVNDPEWEGVTDLGDADES